MGGNTIRDMPGVFDDAGNLVGFVNLKGEEQPVGAGGALPVGGTTGQVLVKLSNNPGDAVWSNTGAGDVTVAGAQTLTNKTITAPVLNGNIGGTPILPTTATLAASPTLGDATTKIATTAFVASTAAAQVVNNMTASTTVAPSKSAVQAVIDAKVANDLSASTTVAPSKTAVQTALDAKVANDLTASTTVAPSKTAVITAIAGVVANDLTPSTTVAPSKTAVAAAVAAVVANDLTASTTVAPSKTAVSTALVAKADAAAVTAALATKIDALSETNLGVSTTYTLYYSTHAMRSLRAAPTAPATLTIDITTGSPPSGALWELTNEGSANITCSGATAATGDTNVITPGRTGLFKLVNGTLRALTANPSASTGFAAISGSPTLTSANHRMNLYTGTAGTVGLGTGAAGGVIEIFHGGTGTLTMSGAALAPNKYKNTLKAGETGRWIWDGSAWRTATLDMDAAGAGDTTAPTLTTAVVENAAPSVVVLTFTENLSGTLSAAAAFAVSGSTVSSVAAGATANIVNLTLAAPVASGASKTVSYTQPGSNKLQDAAANLVATFSGVAITNNVVAPAGFLATTGFNAGGADALPGSPHDLTAAGYLDWMVGGTGAFPYRQKRGVSLITAALGANSSSWGLTAAFYDSAWTGTDGADETNANIAAGTGSDASPAIKTTGGVTNDIDLTFPAISTARKVYLHGIVLGATDSVQILASLSDGSATALSPTYTSTTGSTRRFFIVIEYSSASGATLAVTVRSPSASETGIHSVGFK